VGVGQGQKGDVSLNLPGVLVRSLREGRENLPRKKTRQEKRISREREERYKTKLLDRKKYRRGPGRRFSVWGGLPN